MGYSNTNNFAAAICGLPPSYHASMAVVDNNRPLIKQRTGNYLPRTSFRGDTAEITFLGWELTVEMDYMGHIEGVINDKGNECMCAFEGWALDEIKTLAHAEQLARSAE